VLYCAEGWYYFVYVADPLKHITSTLYAESLGNVESSTLEMDSSILQLCGKSFVRK
jgi:hypothetical protein